MGALTTPRLLLRKPLAEDFDPYWEMKGDPAVTRFTGGVITAPKRERRARFLREWVEADQRTEFSVVERRSGRYLGYCGFLTDGSEPELLYGLRRDCWGLGYGREAAERLLRYGFEELGYRAVTSGTDPANTASERILQKLGMKATGETVVEGAAVRRYRIERESWAAR